MLYLSAKRSRSLLEKPFKGPIIPFGSLVEYYPISAKDLSRLLQFGKKVLPGLFLGCALYAGGIWKGDIRAVLRRSGRSRNWRMRGSCFLFLALVNLSLTGVGAVQVRNDVNPIRRVVNLLQEMARKIAEEGEEEAALYKNFECYCRTTSQELKTNAEEGTARIKESTSKIQAGESVLMELKNRDQSVPSVA